jgi:hypothetical protein
MDQVAIVIPKTRVQEGDSFPVSAYFRDRTTAEADAPSTVSFRVDCLNTGQVIKDWTSAAAGESTSILMQSEYSAIVSRSNATEQRQLTIRANKDASTQVSSRVIWVVKNQDFRT